MKIEYAGRTYGLDLDEATNKQAVKILEFTGAQSLSEWLETCADEKHPAFFRSIDALFWLMLRQNGDDTTPIADVDYKFGRFLDGFRNAVTAETPAGEPEPDPTRPAEGSALSKASSSRRAKSSAAGGGGSPDG